MTINALTICSSSKFYGTAKMLWHDLTQQTDFLVYTPRFDYDEEHVSVSPEMKHNLTTEFLEKIRLSLAIYVIAGGGYTGRSVCIEVGFAYALRKSILISEPPEEAAIAALVTEVVPVSGLVQFLRQPANVVA